MHLRRAQEALEDEKKQVAAQKAHLARRQSEVRSLSCTWESADPPVVSPASMPPEAYILLSVALSAALCCMH